ncbi:lysylphosphatidylglycerol synthase transmembrane domain-containing protein [Liquorilactobacillus hordei]|uniref:Phosphatidylglycerol lysyltransferase n=1 Tax=Liquorilactobacillus hordei DSM 19519 TaxID=1423759 RepID=A0A0R1MHD4_9LACO|nr:lysylphosphatidylglycerol synthase transmembrane domain-containing protein [Liquorilactobacillus hordei]KRL05300.1 hypothetical protein FC92_GL001490 [Liquorilactobacillus hordei DSM 19519]QYH52865.1 flippase-like domain-containing protein [Liquorilactobacillus hordei DSM 19519]
MTRKNKIVLLLMFIFGSIILGFSLRDISFGSLMHDVSALKWEWLLVAFASMGLSLLTEAVVVKILLHREGSKFSWRDTIRIPLIEQLFNGITPFSSGGQPAQLFALLQSGIDAGRATSVLLMKFVVYQSMIVINFVFALFVGFHLIADKMHALSILFIFGFVVHLVVILALLLVMYWYDFTKKLVKLLFKPVKWFSNSERYMKWEVAIDEKIDNFYEESIRLKGNWKLLLKISLLTLVQLSFYYVIPYFILLALNVSHAQLLLVITLHILIVMVISLFPIPGGSGGAEYSFSMIFSTFITNSSKLVLAMILWRFVTYYFGMILGMIALIIPPKNREK